MIKYVLNLCHAEGLPFSALAETVIRVLGTFSYINMAVCLN